MASSLQFRFFGTPGLARDLPGTPQGTIFGHFGTPLGTIFGNFGTTGLGFASTLSGLVGTREAYRIYTRTKRSYGISKLLHNFVTQEIKALRRILGSVHRLSKDSDTI